MVSYPPNGQHICQTFNSQQLGALGDGVDNRLVPVVFFSARFRTVPIFRVATSLELSGIPIHKRKFGKFLAQVLFPLHGHFLFIRTEGDRRDSLLWTPRTKKNSKIASKIRNGMRCKNMTIKENHLQQNNDLRKGFLAVSMTNLSPIWCWYLYMFVNWNIIYIYIYKSLVCLCVWSIRWWYFSVFMPIIKRHRTRPRAEKVVGMVHTSSHQTGAIVHSGRGGTNEARHCGNT